jgi:RNA polymerase sigma-70 factor (ECF subfamily)
MVDWEGIIRRDGPSVWKTAWRVLGDQADADEVFQDACLAALEYSKSHPVQNWRALLQRMAASKAIDRLRRRIRERARARESAVPADHLISREPAPSDRAESAELAAGLRAALTQLPTGQAEAFCLFYMGGQSYAEIAANLSISTDLVGVWLQRARERLRLILSATKDSRSEVSR